MVDFFFQNVFVKLDHFLSFPPFFGGVKIRPENDVLTTTSIRHSQLPGIEDFDPKNPPAKNQTENVLTPWKINGWFTYKSPI